MPDEHRKQIPKFKSSANKLRGRFKVSGFKVSGFRFQVSGLTK
jgi:hypothetical protein